MIAKKLKLWLVVPSKAISLSNYSTRVEANLERADCKPSQKCFAVKVARDVFG